MAYERGTPQRPLSRKARWTILFLLVLVSTALGTLAAASDAAAAWKEERLVIVAAWTFMGCLSVLIPLIRNDWYFVPLILVDLLVSRNIIILSMMHHVRSNQIIWTVNLLRFTGSRRIHSRLL
jgi:hypothetical protein